MDRQLRNAVFEATEKIATAVSKQEILDAVTSYIARHGFTDVLITEMPPPSGRFASHVLLRGWNRGWWDRYTQANLYPKDPIAAHVRESCRPFLWSQVRMKGARHQLVMGEAAAFGLREGFCVPLNQSDGSQICVTMGGHTLELPDGALHALELVAVFAHSRLGRHRPQGPTRRLSPREREVLKWISCGKTDPEIAEILAISRRTAKAHVINAMNKLGAATRAQAAVHALLRRELSL
jgi:LuxR family quorum sensing-dependent transcriptional regulator